MKGKLKEDHFTADGALYKGDKVTIHVLNQIPNTYQVETKSGSTLFPSHAEANNHYQKFVDKNIPCEFYEDGKLKKEHKPIT